MVRTVRVFDLGGEGKGRYVKGIIAKFNIRGEWSPVIGDGFLEMNLTEADAERLIGKEL